MTIKNAFVDAVFAKDPKHNVLVKFNGRKELIKYPADILDLLISDPGCKVIMDAKTGEVIYYKH